MQVEETCGRGAGDGNVEWTESVALTVCKVASQGEAAV